ncbi:MAG: ADP-ribosylglycohydrolase family protein [Fibrobacteres bacterium]|nr:ADP-ribosylglycohydrolase family protein [Fibrobacterota bacterium]
MKDIFKTQKQTVLDIFFFSGLLLLCLTPTFSATLQLTDAQLMDRIKGGWIGQSAANSLGQPFENMGPSQTRTIAPAFGGSYYNVIRCDDDDTYMKLPFQITLDNLKTGPNGIFSATMEDYANAFKNTTYTVWCGNLAARNALRSGINAPYSGGWPYNGTPLTQNGCDGIPAAENIDWSIECQWIGFMTLGLPAYAVKLDSICGHVIAYGNGLYAGTFFNVAISIAPLNSDIHEVVRKARLAIPAQCDIGKNIDTLLSYHDNNPSSTYWDAMNWAFSSGHTKTDGSVGSRSNTTIVVIALLWGDGDMINTTLYACRMGKDTDCNAGDAGAILGTLLGYNNLPGWWKEAYVAKTVDGSGCSFSNIGLSGWNYLRLLDSSFACAKTSILQAGGSHSGGVFTIPVQDIPAPLWFEVYGQAPISLDPNAVKAAISVTPIQGGAPLTCSFKGSSSGSLNLKFFWNFDDGSAVDTHTIVQHTFQKPGNYTVKLAVNNGINYDTAQTVIMVTGPAQTSLKYIGTPIVSITAPSGQGSRDINVIKDDFYPTTGNFNLGYDTYNGTNHTSDYFGYTFSATHSFSRIVFHYSKRDPDPAGGVFENGFGIEVRNNGVWTALNSNQITVAPSYNSSAVASFDSFAVSVSNTVGDGIRVIGAPRGGKWVGCSELDVFENPGTAGEQLAASVTESKQQKIWSSPNPFYSTLNIKVSNWERGATLQILDISGKIISDLTSFATHNSFDKGTVVQWHNNLLPSGIYILAFRNKGAENYQRIVLMR